MKVYVVISFVDHECCHNIEGVFQNKEDAIEFIDGKENHQVWEESVIMAEETKKKYL